MEQAHRKFESQDILVPWRKPIHISTSCEMTSTTNSEDDGQHPYHAYTQTSDSDSNKSFRFRNTFRKKGRGNYHRRGRSIDPGRCSSPGSSSLSSPNETCYSFVRRAIQKLAGGSRRVVGNRPWFLESWIACTHKQPIQKRYDPDGCEYCDICGYDNVDDQPIELLRLEDEEPKELPRRQTFPASLLVADIDAMKSKSMTNIRAIQGNNNNNNNNINRSSHYSYKPTDKTSTTDTSKKSTDSTKPNLNKPKLVKQKKSVCEDDADEALDQPTDMKTPTRNLPDFRESLFRYERGGVLKQRSLNEDMLSIDRLREKERLKQNIQKQTSLNDELIYKRTHTFESIKDSFFSVTSSKKFQMIKIGLTNKIRNSTTNMEKVTGSSLKNGFVKMLQNWKGNEVVSPTSCDKDNLIESLKKCQKLPAEETQQSETTTERRHSKEDGSDSSKDSSLQSDTSVDSEDSFASVIFVPKSDPMSPIGGTSSAGPASPLLKGGCQSAPQSPRIKQSSCPTSPRIKQASMGVHSLTKQFSSPKPSTELLSTTAAVFFPSDEKESIPKSDLLPVKHITRKESNKTLAQKYSVPQIPKFRRTSLNTPTLNDNHTSSASSNITVTNIVVSDTSRLSPEKNTIDCVIHDDARNEKLKKIREMLAQKPGFGMKTTRNNCPIVRKISGPDGKEEAIAKPIPKLLKLEIFNPEEDDDSDSSCVSSPDSVDSVVSIKSTSKSSSPPCNTSRGRFYFPETKSNKEGMSLLEAAANVANTLDEAVEKVIKSNTKCKRKLPTADVFSIIQRRFSPDTMPLLDENGENGDIDGSRRSSNTWNEECHKHLTAFADKLSEKLMREIDDYQLTMDSIDDPYIHRLSAELQDLSKLSAEIKKQNEYLTRLSKRTSYAQKFKSKLCSKCRKYTECSCKPFHSRTKYSRMKNDVDSMTPVGGDVVNGAHNKNGVTKTDNSSSVNSVKLMSSLGRKNDGFLGGIDCGQADKKPQTVLEEEGETIESFKDSLEHRPLIAKGNSTDSCDSSEKVSGSSSNSIISSGATSINFGGPSVASSVGDLSLDSKDSVSEAGSTASLISLESRHKNRLEVMDTLKRKDHSALSDISQDSLPSDDIGGEITYHRYYHVFREGELDQLIDKYVDNLHIVSSTYEHASWCIVAEKVQVWTI
ncbi:hypothetical protein GWI33_002036 [Rhynchophorus ferrugineus]|uniref:Uncharacterized protein n=2 Tax=Rhynchophorus ferrugineus TaxID=354439 RepID=A0A834IZM8_RHYFE|nr:hypothetical protein GWI33_002036 [Rhynchophorus ferrugineus]